MSYEKGQVLWQPEIIFSHILTAHGTQETSRSLMLLTTALGLVQMYSMVPGILMASLQTYSLTVNG
jgi:hypothetical protein